MIARGILDETGPCRSFNGQFVVYSKLLANCLFARPGRAQEHAKRLALMRALHHDMGTGMPIRVGYVEAGIYEIQSRHVIVVVNHKMLKSPALVVAYWRAETPVEYRQDLSRFVAKITAHHAAQNRVIDHRLNSRAA